MMLVYLALRLQVGRAHQGMTPAIAGWIAAIAGPWTGPALRRQHFRQGSTELPCCMVAPGQEAWWVHQHLRQQLFAWIKVHHVHVSSARNALQTYLHPPAPPPRPPHPPCLQLASGSGGSSGTQRLASAGSADSLRQRMSSPTARSLPLDGQLTSSTIAEVAVTDLSKLPEGFNDVSPDDFELIKAIGEGSFGQVRQIRSGIQRQRQNTSRTTSKSCRYSLTGTCRRPTPSQPPAPPPLLTTTPAGVAGQVLPDYSGCEDADPGQQPQCQLHYAAADGTAQPVPRGRDDVQTAPPQR